MKCFSLGQRNLKASYGNAPICLLIYYSVLGGHLPYFQLLQGKHLLYLGQLTSEHCSSASVVGSCLAVLLSDQISKRYRSGSSCCGRNFCPGRSFNFILWGPDKCIIYLFVYF